MDKQVALVEQEVVLDRTEVAQEVVTLDHELEELVAGVSVCLEVGGGGEWEREREREAG